MRTPLVILAGSLLVACSSGTRVIYVPAPAPAPAPTARAIPAPVPPVGVTIVRVDDRRLQVSTNQPAYLAVFEIVPNRGVTLVYPTSPRQRQVALSGSHWLNVSWRPERGDDASDRDRRGNRRRSPEHHVYAIASHRPLRLADGAFDDITLRAMLGARAYRAAEPYETMTALSRRFVPSGMDEEDWSEDVYTMDVAQPSRMVRVAKIYCPDGSITYVRDDMADRAACPSLGRRRGTGAANAPPPRPDSVVASNGRRVQRPMNPGPARVFRVPVPADVQDGGQRSSDGESVDESRPAGGNGGRDAKDAKDAEDAKQNNGNNGQDKGNNGNHYGQERGNNGKGAAAGTDSRGNGKSDDKPGHTSDGHGNRPASDTVMKLQGKPEHPSKSQHSDPKPEQTPVTAPEATDEPKPKSDAKDRKEKRERPAT